MYEAGENLLGMVLGKVPEQHPFDKFFSWQQSRDQSDHGNSTSLGTTRSSCFSEWPLRSYTAFGDTTFLTHPMTHDINMGK